MKYNAKYDRWVSKDGLVYRYDKNKDKLVLCGDYPIKNEEYIRNNTKMGIKLQHRIVWETFNGEIPKGMEIDHINTNRYDNRLENLRCVSHKDNMLNPITSNKKSKSLKGKPSNAKGRPTSEFGIKFKEHFNKSRSDDFNLYMREYEFYRSHNKVCRWEVEDK